MTSASHFIAETDGGGAVCWLWEMQPAGRKARPVRDLSGLEDRLATAVIHGAPLPAAIDWLARARRSDATRPDMR